MDRVNKIIAIEGISGSGKTSISNLIANKLGCIHIGESFHFFNEGEKIPEITINDEISLEKNHMFLLELEKRKNQYLLSQTLLSSDIIMERTFLTLLYTELALKDLNKYCNYNSLSIKINKLINNGDIILPDFIFFLKTNPDIARKRILSRVGETSSFFSNQETLVALYNNMFKLISDNERIRKIDYEIIENNGENDIDIVVDDIYKKIIYIK